MNLNIQRRPGVMNSFLQGYLGGQQIISEQMKNALIQQKIDAETRKENALLEYGQTQDMNKLMQAAPEIAIQYAKLGHEQQKTQLERAKYVDEMAKQGLEAYKQFRPIIAASGQAGWDQYLSFMKKRGLDVDSMPKEYRPGVLDIMDAANMSLKERTALTTPYYKTFEDRGNKYTIRGIQGGKEEIVGVSPQWEPPELKWKPERYLPKEGDGKPIWVIPGQNVPENYIPEKEKLSQQGQLDLTDDAIEQMARRYLIDGTMPGLGLGKAATLARSKIMNRVAEVMGREGITPTGAIANKVVLGGLQTEARRLMGQRGPMLAFAETADKNLDLALSLSEKVDRTGMPAFNRWLLAGRKSIAGDADVAAFDAATRVAINEFAKVTSSATGGGVTSDSARKEMEDILNKAATSEQFKAVVNTLKTDMKNRIAGYDVQIENIQNSTKGLGGSGTGGGIKVGDGQSGNKAMDLIDRQYENKKKEISLMPDGPQKIAATEKLEAIYKAEKAKVR